MRRTRWLCGLLLIAGLTLLLSMADRSEAYVYGRVGPSSYPADGTVTFLAYLSKSGDTDNEVLTEDKWNCGLGLDNGYASQFQRDLAR